MPRFIVERQFDPPLTEADLKATEGRMAPCLDLYNVRWIRSYWSADRKRMICEYDGPDAASVKSVAAEINVAGFESPTVRPDRHCILNF